MKSSTIIFQADKYSELSDKLIDEVFSSLFSLHICLKNTSDKSLFSHLMYSQILLEEILVNSGFEQQLLEFASQLNIELYYQEFRASVF